jgi:hypothetical protein
LASLTDAALESNSLCECREFDDKLYVSLTAINNHVTNNHFKSRILNNLQLVEQALFFDLEGNYTSHWADGLAVLSELKHRPPPFWQPLTTKIRWRLEQHDSETFLSVVTLNNEALKHRNTSHTANTLTSTLGPYSNLKSYSNN